MGWLARLSEGLAKTRERVQDSLARLVSRGPDPAVLEELETTLIAADLGVHTVQRLMERLQAERGRFASAGPGESRMLAVLKHTLLETFRGCEGRPLETLVQEGPKPYIVLAVGVNGVGKTTTVAKLAQRLKAAGHKPVLVAADTFRAAAIEQLAVWGGRTGVDVVRHQHGSDPSAVVFDGLAAAKARNADVLLIDTAGRLHTKSNLMDELKKMKRVLARELPGAPHEVLLVLDGTTGQNALSQARQFHAAVGVTGLVVTKLDGTARGGIVVAIAEELKIPVRLIGVGEGIEDLQDFHAGDFVDALVEAQ